MKVLFFLFIFFCLNLTYAEESKEINNRKIEGNIKKTESGDPIKIEKNNTQPEIKKDSYLDLLKKIEEEDVRIKEMNQRIAHQDFIFGIATFASVGLGAGSVFLYTLAQKDKKKAAEFNDLYKNSFIKEDMETYFKKSNDLISKSRFKLDTSYTLAGLSVVCIGFAAFIQITKPDRPERKLIVSPLFEDDERGVLLSFNF